MCCTGLAANTGCKKSPSGHHRTRFIGLYLCYYTTYRQSEKNLVKQQYLLHMVPQYGELQPTSGWDRSGSLGHPCKFQRVSRLGSVTARHSCIGRQPNFAVLNGGRHLYSAGRPSCWALAHILVDIELKTVPLDILVKHGVWAVADWLSDAQAWLENFVTSAVSRMMADNRSHLHLWQCLIDQIWLPVTLCVSERIPDVSRDVVFGVSLCVCRWKHKPHHQVLLLLLSQVTELPHRSVFEYIKSVYVN